jgi:hypothetical protein
MDKEDYFSNNKSSFNYEDEDEDEDEDNVEEPKLYTEDSLRLAFRAGVLKGGHGSYYDAPLDEDEYIQSLNPIKKEEIVEVPYFWIKNNIGWSEFCDITGNNHYAIKEFGEPTWDLEVTISDAKKIGYIR